MMGKTGLLYRLMRNTKLPVIFAHEYNLSIGNPHELAREIRLPFNGDIRFYPYVISRERLKITLFPQRSVGPRGGNFEGKWAINGVLRVEESADGLAHVGTIFHRDSLVPVDIVANQEPAPAAIDLDLDER